MMRHCDGTDPNLLMRVDPDTRKRASDGVRLVDYVPCNCGLRFDDVRRMVIWPHYYVHDYKPGGRMTS